jgi:hypothetical protein
MKIWIKEDNIDDWFTGEGYSAKGEVVAAINKYKADMKSVLGTENMLPLLG